MEKIIANKFQALSGVLTERQRRLWAAVEAECLGHGGVAIVFRATGISRATITRGIKELQAENTLSSTQSRQPGGGRKKR